MSFISMIATKDFISVVADGLMTSSLGYTDQNYKKFRTYGSEMVVAFGGSYTDFEGLFDKIMSAYQSASSIDSYYSQVDSIISSTSYNPNSAKLLCLTAAFKNGQGSYMTTSNNGQLRGRTQLTSDLSYSFLSPSGVSESSIASKLNSLAAGSIIQSIDQVVNIQKQLNDFVADRDSSVNHNINYTVLTR